LTFGIIIEEPFEVVPEVLLDDTPITISTNIIDYESGVNSVFLYYTSPDSQIFCNKQMVKEQFSNIYKVTLPAFNRWGKIEMFIKSIDFYGNEIRTKIYQYVVDINDFIPPLNPSEISCTHEINVESFNNNIGFYWSGASDDKSGIMGYSITLSKDPNYIPKKVCNITHKEEMSYIFEKLLPGEYYFYLQTVDNKGNWAETYIKLGPYKISSKVQLKEFDDVGTEILSNVINKIHDFTQETLFTLDNGEYGPFHFIKRCSFSIGLEIELNIEFDLSVNNEIVRISIRPNVAGEIPLSSYSELSSYSLFGVLGKFNYIFKNLEIFKLKISGGTELLFNIVTEFNKFTRIWNIIEYEGGIGLYLKFEYDYIRVFITAYGGTMILPFYDGFDYMVTTIIGHSVSSMLTGFIKIGFNIIFSYNKLLQETKTTFNFIIEMSTVTLDIGDDGYNELQFLIETSGMIESYSNPKGKFLKYGIELKISLSINLETLYHAVKFIPIIHDALRIILPDEVQWDFYIVKMYSEPIILEINTNISDIDNDGISDYDEKIGVFGFKTDIMNPDTDGDNLTDYDEIFIFKTNPLKNDSDGDGLYDYEEINGGLLDIHRKGNGNLIFIPTDPNNFDTDGDLLSDSEEIFGIIWDNKENKWIENPFGSTDPFKNDTDSDGFTDSWEILYFLTNPNDKNDFPIDTDNDNLFDQEESYYFGTSKYLINTDNDGLSDFYELTSYPSLDPLDPDIDKDNLLDGQEVLYFSTNPLNNDSDSDLIDDYNEIFIYATNPNMEDSDGDYLSDSEEILLYFTNPLNNDTDGDKFLDGEEINENTDPLNPNDFPQNCNKIIIFIIEIISLILIISISLSVVLTKFYFNDKRQESSNKFKQENPQYCFKKSNQSSNKYHFKKFKLFFTSKNLHKFAFWKIIFINKIIKLRKWLRNIQEVIAEIIRKLINYIYKIVSITLFYLKSFFIFNKNKKNKNQNLNIFIKKENCNNIKNFAENILNSNKSKKKIDIEYLKLESKLILEKIYKLYFTEYKKNITLSKHSFKVQNEINKNLQRVVLKELKEKFSLIKIIKNYYKLHYLESYQIYFKIFMNLGNLSLLKSYIDVNNELKNRFKLFTQISKIYNRKIILINNKPIFSNKNENQNKKYGFDRKNLNNQYEDDLITIKGIGIKTKRVLIKKGIYTVQQLKIILNFFPQFIKNLKYNNGRKIGNRANLFKI